MSVFLLCAFAAAPTRSTPEAFKLMQEGVVPTSEVPAFADCLLDGFDRSHFMPTNVAARQQRRSDGYRVETLVDGRLILMSADVFEDGRVQLFEAKAAKWVNTSGERKVFAQCLEALSKS